MACHRIGLVPFSPEHDMASEPFANTSVLIRCGEDRAEVETDTSCFHDLRCREMIRVNDQDARRAGGVATGC